MDNYRMTKTFMKIYIGSICVYWIAIVAISFWYAIMQDSPEIGMSNAELWALASILVGIIPAWELAMITVGLLMGLRIVIRFFRSNALKRR